MKNIKWPKKHHDDIIYFLMKIIKWITIISIINQKIDIINYINSIFSDDIKMSYNLSLEFQSRPQPLCTRIQTRQRPQRCFTIESMVFPSFSENKTPHFPWFGKNITIFSQKNETIELWGFSQSWGYPKQAKWMVYFMEHPKMKWMRTGGSPILGNLHMGVLKSWISIYGIRMRTN